MKKEKLNSIIINYIKENLYPTPKEQEFISKKYHELKNILKGRTFQNGSYARNTSTTPVNDLDVFYVLTADYYRVYKNLLLERKAFNVDNILEELFSFLKNEYGKNARIKLQTHSIGIFFGDDDEFSIDIVPSIPTENEIFWVPESSQLSITKRREFYENLKTSEIIWIKSDPKGYIEDATNIDELTNNNFRKATKFVKKWKLACKKLDRRFPMKSFHIELIVNKSCKENSFLPCLDYIALFFDSITKYLEQPSFRDKAEPAKYVDEYVSSLTSSDKELVFQFRDDAKNIITEIHSADTESEVISLIEKLLDIVNSKPMELLIPAISKPYCY